MLTSAWVEIDKNRGSSGRTNSRPLGDDKFFRMVVTPTPLLRIEPILS